jgi:hypothetical protein
MGPLIAGNTNSTVLANPAKANLNPKLLSFIALLLGWLGSSSLCPCTRSTGRS